LTKDDSVTLIPAGESGDVLVCAPTAPVEMTTMEIGYLHAFLWGPAALGEPLARSLYLKMKAAAISLDVVWRYGDPWNVEAEPPVEKLKRGRRP
jgi:hypothetical protein